MTLDKHELGRFRAIKLSPFDVGVLTTMMKTGGEFPFYIDRLPDDTRDQAIANMNSLIGRGLIEVDRSRSSGHRLMLRLTFNGHEACAHLEKMNAQSRVEVQMNDGVPEVVKP